jgi:multisubunit Na+/H+ antiporter MnhC subunit
LPPPAVTPPGQQLAMFIMAFSLLTIAVVLVLFLVRRSRGGRQPSLISQSIDRSR